MVCLERVSRVALVGDERVASIAQEILAPFEKFKLNEETETGDLALKTLDQPRSGRRGSSGGEEIIDDVSSLARRHGVHVHLDGVRAVFQRVLLSDAVIRELADLARQHEGKSELERKRNAKDEPAAFDADDHVRIGFSGLFGHPSDDLLKRSRMLENRSDILKDDPRLRKVRDVSNQRLSEKLLHAAREDTQPERASPRSRETSNLVFDFGARFPALIGGAHQHLNMHGAIHAELATEAELSKDPIFL